MKTLLTILSVIIFFTAIGQNCGKKSENKTAQQYYDNALKKYNSNDLYNAIKDFDFAIQFDPNFADAYNYRGLAKYNYRGIAKINKEDNTGACKDFLKACQLGSNAGHYNYNNFCNKNRRKLSDKCE